MPLETTATYIDSLDITQPDGATITGNFVDDQLRMMKATIRRTLSGLTGAVTATHTELNRATYAVLRNSSTTVSATVVFAVAPLYLTQGGRYVPMNGMYVGQVDSSGTAVSLPSGWTCSQPSSGQGVYKIKHNLNIPVTLGSILPNPMPGSGSRYACVTSQSSNSFQVSVVDPVALTQPPMRVGFIYAFGP